MIRIDGFLQMSLGKVWPASGREIEFRVSALHEEKIAETILAGRADNKVGIWQAICVQVLFDVFPFDVLRIQLSLHGLFHELSHGIDNFVSRAVVQCEYQVPVIELASRLHSSF